MTLLQGSIRINAGAIPGCPGHQWNFPTTPEYAVGMDSVGSDGSMTGHICFSAQHEHDCYSQCVGALWSFTFHALTLSIESSGYSQEGSTTQVGQFVVSRTDTSPIAPAVNLGSAIGYQVGYPGSATSGSDYTPLDTHVRFGVGQTSTSFPVVASDDRTPEWTEYVRADLSASGHFYVVPTKWTATVDIVDPRNIGIALSAPVRSDGNKWIWVNNDDDNKNGRLDWAEQQSSGDDDLYALELSFPYIVPGTSVTLSLISGAVNVWASANKGLRLLGGSVFSVALTNSNHSVYVEAVGKSLAPNDIVFMLQASDSKQVTHPSNPTPATTQAAADPHPTQVTFIPDIAVSTDAWRPINFVSVGHWKVDDPSANEGQIVQHLVFKRKMGKWEPADQNPAETTLIEYYEAWTVKVDGQGKSSIQLRKKQGGDWYSDQANRDIFALGSGAGRNWGGEDNHYGTITEIGTYVYIDKIAINANTHDVDASHDVASVESKPGPFDDAQPKKEHSATYKFVWPRAVDGKYKEEPISTKLSVSPTPDGGVDRWTIIRSVEDVVRAMMNR